MQTPHEHEVTQLLADWRQGDESAAARLLPLVYDQLRALAGSFFEHQAPGHTLEPTALVHEAYLRLASGSEQGWNDRKHFFNVAARAMRQLLADSARRRRAEKRGGGWARISLGSDPAAEALGDADLLTLDDALTQLSALDPRQGRIVELRYLTGLSVEETAEILGVSPRTVELDWRLARAWLRRELDGELPA